VYGPSIANPANASLVGDLSAYLDFGSLHPYPGGQVPMFSVGRHSDGLRSVSGDKPTVVTESGYHTALLWTGGHPPVSEQAMGRYVLRLLLDYFNAGIARTYLYELIDQGFDLADREKHFGLLRADGTEKPAYRGLRNLIELLEEPRPGFSASGLAYALEGDTTSVNAMLLEQSDRFFLALWQDAPSFDLIGRTDRATVERRVTVRFTAPKRVRVFEPLETTTAVADLADRTMIDVGVPDHPILLEITTNAPR
jgi:hypothetical protein